MWGVRGRVEFSLGSESGRESFVLAKPKPRQFHINQIEGVFGSKFYLSEPHKFRGKRQAGPRTLAWDILSTILDFAVSIFLWGNQPLSLLQQYLFQNIKCTTLLCPIEVIGRAPTEFNSKKDWEHQQSYPRKFNILCKLVSQQEVNHHTANNFRGSGEEKFRTGLP